MDKPTTNTEFNQEVRKWTSKVRRKLRTSARWFSDGKTDSMVTRGQISGHVRTEGKLHKSINSKLKQFDGRYDSASFSFERHGVFVHKGVGRGYPLAGGFITKAINPTPRVAVEWFNPVLNMHVPELADKIAEMDANAAVNATRLRIV